MFLPFYCCKVITPLYVGLLPIFQRFKKSGKLDFYTFGIVLTSSFTVIIIGILDILVLKMFNQNDEMFDSYLRAIRSKGKIYVS